MKAQKDISRAKLLEERGPEVIKKEKKEQNIKDSAKLLDKKGPEVILAEQNNQKQKSRNKLRVELGPQQVRKQQNLWEKKSRKRKISVNPELTKHDENKRKNYQGINKEKRIQI